MSLEKKKALKLSDYVNSLDSVIKARYLKKISCIGVDPFLISGKNYDPECLPSIESIDLVSYLVLETSYYTKEQFKAFKSLQAYNQMVSGFIQSVEGHLIANKHVILGKVRHSQKMNDLAIPLWIIAEGDGRVLSAHCRCMAGQGESCSHIASVLFYVETFSRVRGKLACTDIKCAWIMPGYNKDVAYAQAQDIDFRSAAKLKQKLDEAVENLGDTSNKNKTFSPEYSKPVVKRKIDIPAPTQAELNSFYETLNNCKSKPVALSLIHPYSETFVAKSRTIGAISDLHDTKYMDMEYNDLLDACSKVRIDISLEQIKIIEEDTRKQSSSNIFFRHRAGRIGASMSKQACQTNPAQPSHSLIKTICHPNIFKFSNAATEHGCKHEKLALNSYELTMKEKHIQFKIKECGLFVISSIPGYMPPLISFVYVTVVGRAVVRSSAPIV